MTITVRKRINWSASDEERWGTNVQVHGSSSHGETINESRLVRIELHESNALLQCGARRTLKASHDAASPPLSTSDQHASLSVDDGNVTNPYIMRWWANRTHLSSLSLLDTLQTHSNTLPKRGRKGDRYFDNSPRVYIYACTRIAAARSYDKTWYMARTIEKSRLQMLRRYISYCSTPHWHHTGSLSA